MNMVEGVLIIAFVMGLGIVAASLYFYKLAVNRSSKSFLSGDPDTEMAKKWKRHAEANQEWLSRQSYEDVEIQSYDGLKLHGYYMAAQQPTNKVAILVHGYSGQGRDMVSYASIYYDSLGYNVLMPDNRGHGLSEGHYIGFGWHDRKDYLKWIDYVIARFGNEVELVLHGVSMGGATVLMTSGEELPEQVKVIVADCAYTSVYDQLTYQLKQMFRLPSFPLLSTTSLVCRLRAGYSFKEATALKQVERAKTPILFIHGEEDTFVPTQMVYPLHERCNSEKELWIVPKAAHGASILEDYEGYVEKVKTFVNRYIPV
ncbi:alpha/beta hydrolase [Paenibacillus taiwanensis]|uniref:alpha/beta hydrolase n=1 Tax=Paenibacillus taiwanensis TaxID=401638 RepID=UPI0004105D7A|nr:alpha/beta hydrolase [Paenibacillus taiwanensis]